MKKEIITAALSALALIALSGSVSYLLFPQVTVQAYTASIDIFTQKGGQGKDKPGGDFAPLELMNLTAEVRNASNNQLGGRLVSFEIYKPPDNATGATVATVGVATTDPTGIGTYSFRIPPPDAPNTIGKWLVYSTVDVDGQLLADTLTFSVQQ